MDEQFSAYAEKHKCWSVTVGIFSCMCTFKCNKSYYSHFYSFDMFKAHWRHGKKYRKSMTCFSAVSIIIDVLIIFVCAVQLIEMEPFSNMLWITLVEVVLLTLFLIVCGCIELCHMKSYLAYTEQGWSNKKSLKKIHVAAEND